MANYDDIDRELDATVQPMDLLGYPGLARWIIYGDKYAGKTTLVLKCIAALGHKGLFITADSAWTVMLRPEYRENVNRLPWDGFSQIDQVARRINSKEPGWTFDWVVLDPISTMVTRYIANITKTKKFPKDQYDPDVAGRTHYGIALNRVRETVDALTNISCNVVYITHELDREDEPKKRSNLPIGSFNELAREVNLIGYCYRDKRGEQARKVQVEPDLRITAGTQLPMIPEATYEIDQFVSHVVDWLKPRSTV